MKSIIVIFLVLLTTGLYGCSKEPDITTGSSKKSATTTTPMVSDTISSVSAN